MLKWGRRRDRALLSDTGVSPDFGADNNANEPNSYVEAACNYSEGKDVQNESYRAGLSYNPNILKELKVNFKLLPQAQVKEVSS